jgi:hypothetical protein
MDGPGHWHRAGQGAFINLPFAVRGGLAHKEHPVARGSEHRAASRMQARRQDFVSDRVDCDRRSTTLLPGG